MIRQQQTLMLSPYAALYDIVVPKDNMLRQINELVDFTFIYDELETKYCLDNGRNAIDLVRMFKYLLLMGEDGIGRLKQRVHGVTDIYGIEKPSYQVLRETASPMQMEWTRHQKIVIYRPTGFSILERSLDV